MEIKLKTISVKNFKKYADETFNFDEKDSLISGKNGYGKSTVWNAYLWCLLNKDIDGKVDGSSIRTVGMPVEVIPEVNVVLTVDGVETTFTRKLEPTFTGRGEARAYKGDTSTLYIDGLPKNATEFNAYLNSLFPTDPLIWLDILSFCEDSKIKPEVRRDMLVTCFGNVSDEDVKAMNFEYDALFAAKGKLSVDDFKIKEKEVEKICTAELGRGKTAGTIQSRIDEATKAITDPTLSVATQELRIAGIEAQIQSVSSGDNGKVKARLSELRKEQSEIAERIGKFIAETKNDLIKKANNDVTVAQTNSVALANEIQSIETKRKTVREKLEEYGISLSSCKLKLDSLITEEFKIVDTCPTCGQKIPQAQIDEAIENFNEQKSEKMAKLEEDIKTIEDYIAKDNAELKALEDKLEPLKADKAKAEAECDAMRDKQAEVYALVIEPTPELKAESKRVQAEIDEVTSQLQGTGSSEKLAELTAELKEAQSLLEQAKQNEKQRERIAELQEQQRKVSEELSTAQRMIALCDQFIVDRAMLIEKNINEHFNGVTFKLFDFFKNGEIKNSCIAYMDGKPYRLLSFSQKILASVAIINGLSEHYGFYAPIFVDNCSELDNESLDKLATKSQKIIIKVSNDAFAITSL